MKAWLLEGFDGLDALRLGETPTPQPGEGEVLVRTKCASLNPADRFLAQGQYPARPPLPHILGRDGVGVVERIGDGVTSVKPGNRVAVLRGDAGVTRWGTFAEFANVPHDVLEPAPPDWSDEETAAAPLVYLTAHQALNQWGPLDGGTVLITGATGGVGLASVHQAKGAGARVIALTRSQAKAKRLREMGADLTLEPSDPELRTRTKELTGGRGVDRVVDNVAGDLFLRVLETLGYGGRISVVGMLGGPVPSFNTAKLIFKRIRIGGVSVGDYGRDEAHAAWQDVVTTLNRLQIRPIVDTVYPFEKIQDAFAHLARGPLGKILLRVGGAS